MPRQNSRRNKRIRNLIIVSSFTAVVLMVSTFAWFIGMRTVNVSSFNVEIASTDSLLLSLNGADWDTTVKISESTLESVSYSGHTNSWGGAGLVPVSSVGEMDLTASRMKLFEKASLTASAGGYRLLASRVDNTGAEELGGYVVFDLFIKNFTGAQYITALNELDEEAIYLTTDSIVKVADDGGIENTGIENSVRVAFAQIGRVSGTTTDVSKITGITCNEALDEDDEPTGEPGIVDEVTGICRTAQIWEPNDKDHVADAISWYDTSCLARNETTGVYTTDSCGTVEQGFSYPTYAVRDEIESSDKVDVYDGAAYNGYKGSEPVEEELDEDGETVITEAKEGFLYPYPYFKDSDKIKTGTSRPTFITLAPNSITKVRIYIYIEGQDVDNYDFASIGKKISINFGFTKQRYTAEDIEYNGPSLNASNDTTKPVITVKGDTLVYNLFGQPYEDEGATAKDPGAGAEGADLDITNKIKTVNPVNVNKAGTYTITYMVSDWAGNYAEQKTRTVIVLPEGEPIPEEEP